MKTHKQHLIFIAGMMAGILVVGVMAFNNNQPKTAATPDLSMPYKWQTVQVPAQMTFAGEAVPLNRWEVHEEMDRQLQFNYYWPSNILYILKKANRYFPLIEARLKANGIPDDFKYLCVAESSLQNAISKAGAVGFWQFMSDTGPGYNLTINAQVDHRYDVTRSTDAACTYLKNAYAKFGSWTAAAASYNCGQGGYASHAAFQKTTNYYDLFLPAETNQYIFRILTLKYLIENAVQLGYVLDSSDLYKPLNTRTITVSATVHNLTDLAITNGTTYKMLKILNPWLRSTMLTVKPGAAYEILLPAE